MAVTVSVVVATYNTGAALDAMLESVRQQSIGLDELELILIDDGSTDGTGERVMELAEREPWVVGRRIPNSGWPSRPRNVGLSLAQGEFVMVMDHDDELYPEGLQRMVAAGVDNGSDMVIGKEVRAGARTMGLDTFRRNVPRAHIVDDHILEMLTPHRMWRREFLDEHGIRFSETLRRLEDHKVIAQTLEHDPVVSVVADHPCYRWIIHGANSSLRLPDPVEYYDALREVLDSLDRWPYGQVIRDAGRLTWLRSTVLDRFGPTGMRTWPADYQGQFFEQARRVTLERFPESLDCELAPAYRVRAALLRADDLAGLLEYVESDRHVTTRPVVTGTTSSPGAVWLDIQTTLVRADGPVVFHRSADGRVRQHPSGDLPSEVATSALDVTDDLRGGRVDVLMVHRESEVEWFLPTTSALELQQGEDGDLTLRISARAELSPATAALGAPLVPGIWDVRLRTAVLGYDSRVAVRIEAEQLPQPLEVADLVARPYVTRGGRLAVEIRRAAPRPQATKRPAQLLRAASSRARRLARGLYRRLHQRSVVA
jgi:poly(ribitol-phosphate) beta-N-acetylglucosaminyltransferase